MISDLLATIKIEDFINKDALIGIKPNLVVAKPSSSGATTSPELVEGVIRYLKSKGFKNIAVLESSWVGDKTSKAFEICGYTKIAKNLDIPLIDLQKDTHKAYSIAVSYTHL
ncbi:MAG TPA: iron-sulfur cluster-binding protein, partial [Peptococcaceae bacterium]|nr:iron-sulfur cluster-binding protein [Peptococcaceae bacterium]